MRVKLRGRYWRMAFTRLLNRKHDGECDGPTQPSKSIRIRPGLPAKRELIVLIHEMMHACSWDLSEEAVTEIAEDIGAALYKCGYRRDDTEAIPTDN